MDCTAAAAAVVPKLSRRPRWPRHSLSLNKHWALTPPTSESLIRPNKALSLSSSNSSSFSRGNGHNREADLNLHQLRRATKHLLKTKRRSVALLPYCLATSDTSSRSPGIADTGHTLPGPEPPSPSPPPPSASSSSFFLSPSSLYLHVIDEK